MGANGRAGEWAKGRNGDLGAKRLPQRFSGLKDLSDSTELAEVLGCQAQQCPNKAISAEGGSPIRRFAHSPPPGSFLLRSDLAL